MRTLMLLVPVLFLSTAVLPAAEKCPISGAPAKDDVFLEVNGKEVHFCCDKCPEAYKKKIGLKDEGPGTCPISGEKASKDVSLIEQRAEAVYFCCGDCPKAFAKKNGFEPKDAGPTKCPVSGGPAKKGEGTSRIVNGETVYFCCANCPKKYEQQLGVVDKVATEKAAAKCPVSGAPAKAETRQILVSSRVVYFCCEGCKDKYIEKNFKDGVAITPPPPAKKAEK